MSKSLVLHQKHAILHLHTNEIKHPTLFFASNPPLFIYDPFFYHPNTPNLIQTKKNKNFLN